jgi:Zn-dependent protease/predicted transcriptional regulator
MTGWSFTIGKVFGVEVRLHSFFVLLLGFSILWAGILGRMAARGVMLWGLLLLAVVVREIARAVAASYFSLDVKSVLLLPTGGLMSYGSLEGDARAAERGVQRVMALVGPTANLLFGLMLAGFVLTVAPTVDLLDVPWVTPAHLVRTMVWVNLLLAALNLLPAWPLDGGRVARGEVLRGAASGAAARMLPGRLQTLVRAGALIAVVLIVSGLMTRNWWVIMAGLGVLLGAQVERQGLLPERETDTTRVGDVMLTEYSMLPASATLEDAMMQARHSLQDVFPVVRAGNMVGAVGRQSIVEALATNGNGYVQGIMTRSFQTAKADDLLLDTLNKAVVQSGSSLQIVPVVDGDAVVGILTPQHLQRSLGLLPRRLMRGGRTAAEDETD